MVTKQQQEVRDEITAYFPFTTYWVLDTTRTHGKHLFELLFCCCVCIRCRENVFTELLRSEGRLFWPHYFALLERDTQTARWFHKPPFIFLNKESMLKVFIGIPKSSRSQWLRGLRHELSSPARTLGSWVQIPLEAWMSVCAFLLCLCCSVCR
jgi:hypothetical protein